MMMSKRSIAALFFLLVLATGCASQGVPLEPLITPEPLMVAAPADAVLSPRSVKRSAAVRVAGMVPAAKKIRLHLFPDVVFDAGFTVLQGTKPVARTVMTYDRYCKSLGLTCPRLPTYSTDTAGTMTLGIPCSVKKTGVEGSANNAAQFVIGAPIAAAWQ